MLFAFPLSVREGLDPRQRGTHWLDSTRHNTTRGATSQFKSTQRIRVWLSNKQAYAVLLDIYPFAIHSAWGRGGGSLASSHITYTFFTPLKRISVRYSSNRDCRASDTTLYCSQACVSLSGTSLRGNMNECESQNRRYCVRNMILTTESTHTIGYEERDNQSLSTCLAWSINVTLNSHSDTDKCRNQQ